MGKKIGYILCLTVILLTGCSEYQQLLKSTDPELKYTKALEYFNKKDYMRAQSLLDDIAHYYKGTERAEDVLYYLSQCYMGQKDYYSAGEYYSSYTRNYPKGRYAEEAFYMVGYCYYLDSPDARLDQAATYEAIKALQNFVDRFPDSSKTSDAYRLLDEMNNKLAQKELLSARLYYNLGTYRGNNYASAVIVANNALKDYPMNKYREELSYIVLSSMYQQAVLSTRDKQEERYREALDEYYSYVNEFPSGKHRKDAERIFKDIDRAIKHVEI